MFDCSLLDATVAAVVAWDRQLGRGCLCLLCSPTYEFFFDAGDWNKVVAEQEVMGCRGFAMRGSWTD